MRIAALVLVLILVGPSAHADGLRCGNDLVQRGDSIISVERKCGEPIREADLVNDRGKVVGTILYFDAGYGKADRRVTFRAGRVVRIERVR